MEEDLFNEIDLSDDHSEEAELDLPAIVGDSGRYRNVEELARAAIEKDKFIEKLKAEAAELRMHNQKATTLESVLEQVKKMTSPNSNAEQVPQNLENQTPAQIDDSKLKQLVSEMLKQTEFERTVTTNRDKVQKALVEAWGTEAQVKLNQKARELDIPINHLRAIADERPNSFLRLVGITGVKESPANVAQSSVSTVNKSVATNGAKTKAFYDALKLRDPKAYNSASTRDQMMKDAMSLGAKFFDA